MTYPDPRYAGDAGEVSARVRSTSLPPDVIYPNGTTAHYLATGAETERRFGLYRWEMGPVHSGPSPHFHRSFSESFYILEGTVRIFDGDRWVDAVPGDFIYVPEGGIHAFRNASGEPASMLILFAPGAPREAYFEGLATQTDMTDEQRRAFQAAHDQFPAG